MKHDDLGSGPAEQMELKSDLTSDLALASVLLSRVLENDGMANRHGFDPWRVIIH